VAYPGAMTRSSLRFTLLPLAALVAAACAHAPPSPAPGAAWLQFASPEEAGLDPSGLDEAFRRADEAGSAAVMVIRGGHAVAAWGDPSRELDLHSVRKSLYGVLYGIAVERGLVDLEATLAALEVDDLEPLSAAERSARVVDLLAARSGVYHPSAYSPSDMDESLPARGSHPPGSHFFYNNWDFNVAGALLEQAAGRDLDRLFADWIAVPIGMEDWRPGDSFAAYEPRTSRWPAHTFRMSTRDLARFAQLVLDGGAWRGAEVVPRAWIERSTAPISRFDDGSGYALMWWVYPPGALPADRYPATSQVRVVQARGTGGQAIFLVPEADLAVVHRGDTDRGEGVSGARAWGILEAVLAARRGEPAAHPTLVPMTPRPLPSQTPFELPAMQPAAGGAAAELVGHYRLAPGVFLEIFPFRGGVYADMPGEGEAELWTLGPDLYTVRVEPSVRIAVERDADGRVVALAATIGERRVRATRADPP
jgi:CubicO group peptidase (beta-lactamase class C family)